MTNEYIKNNEKAIKELNSLRRELNEKERKLAKKVDECEWKIADNLTDQSLIGKKVRVVIEYENRFSYSSREKITEELVGYYHGFKVVYYGISLVLNKVKKDGSESKLEYHDGGLDYQSVKSIEAIE